MTGGPGTIAILTQAVLAVILVLVGSWGRSAAQTLPPTFMDEEERAHRAAVMRRGSTACIVVGAVLALSVLWAVAS